MKYVCGYCGKISDDVETIKSCEEKHEELKKKTEEAKTKRDALYSEYKADIEKIDKLVKEINDKYSACDFPTVGTYTTRYSTTGKYANSLLSSLWSDFLR